MLWHHVVAQNGGQCYKSGPVVQRAWRTLLLLTSGMQGASGVSHIHKVRSDHSQRSVFYLCGAEVNKISELDSVRCLTGYVAAMQEMKGSCVCVTLNCPGCSWGRPVGLTGNFFLGEETAF